MNPTRSRLLPASLAILLAAVLASCGGGATAAPSAPSGSSAASAPVESGGAAELASTIPTTVGDVTLTVKAADLASLQGEIPSYDELVLTLRNAGIEPADVIGAIGTPADGGDVVRVSGLQVVNVPPGGVGMEGFLTAWAQTLPNATVTGTNVGGKPVTQVTFSDGTTPLYYYTFDLTPLDSNETDTLYFVRTADETLATSAFEQLPPAKS